MSMWCVYLGVWCVYECMYGMSVYDYVICVCGVVIYGYVYVSM